MRKKQKPSARQRKRGAGTSFRMLRPAEMQESLSVSETTLWRLSNTPDFPGKYHLSANAVGWREDEVEAWLEQQRTVEPLTRADRDLIKGLKPFRAEDLIPVRAEDLKPWKPE